MSRAAMVLGSALSIALVTGAHATAVTVGSIYQEGSVRQSITPPTATSCNGMLCHVVFNVVPTGKQLLITDASCWTQLTGDGSQFIYRAEIITFSTSGAATDRAHHFPQAPTVTVSGTFVTQNYVTTTRQILKAGERPVIRFLANSAANWGVACSISGKIGNPPE